MVNCKGLSYSLEALIATSIVIASMVIVFGSLPTPQTPGLPEAAENSFSCLRGLDNEGKLRADAVTQNTTAINDNLRGCIRGAFNFTTQVCKTTCTTLSLDQTKDITSARYYVGGHNQTDPTVVIVYVWSIL